ncbi:alpha-hydroxy acid oxidase [Nocardioides sp.]|uniref:alpha-hydroxy acid oxidase n=1 Tax=Nocardioides sp. TaxID=35761 RepID=UPI0027259E24|nr:alpha-hydroxy acid oxidase [Nocardioides sp.]MDO9454867.1 alpha-hydroxy acid oxidase [Nocardioides sp.]
MSDARWLAGLEEQARARLPAPVFEYVVQGARDSTTADAAAASWRRWVLHPRVLRDVTTVDVSTDVLGRRTAVPFGVAPSTLQRAIHPDGELAVARAVAAADGLLVVSSNAGTPFRQIGETGVRWWVQSYLPADRTLAEPLLHRAVEAGADAVVLTVDTPVVGTKYARNPEGTVIWDVVDPALLRVNFDPGYDDAPGSEKALDLGPHDLDWLTTTTGLPVVVKGVLRGDDAARAVDAGAAAVWVSNHGGRQLDRAVSTAAALPGVVAAVAGRVQVYVDGGVRSGLDVATALALGADTTFLGRLPLYALVEGEPGVRRMLAELHAQTLETLRLCGATRVDDTRGLIDPQPFAGL